MNRMHTHSDPVAVTDVDGFAAWVRLAVAVLIGTIGGVGMWSGVVALPAVQAEFGVARAQASLPYTLTMIGFAFGGVLIGRFADRWGIVPPLIASTVTLTLGYLLAGWAANDLWQFALAYGLLIGVGASVTFGPLMADLSQWFARYRGIAVAISACGNYLAGALWPPVLQHFIELVGWRMTHVSVGLFCLVTIPPMALLLRRPGYVRWPASDTDRPSADALTVPPLVLQALLCGAALACCVAMAMPQVHIVAYCGDLGYGVARGAEMLSLMLACGIISRATSGVLADRIGALWTLLIGSALQGAALILYLSFNALTSLYVISALFGLFQGGIVPMYALVVRDYFPPREAATRIGIVLMASVFGMALGGWMSGAIFDLSGSYQAAFANGLLFNLLNLAIVSTLLWRLWPRPAYA